MADSLSSTSFYYTESRDPRSQSRPGEHRYNQPVRVKNARAGNNKKGKHASLAGTEPTGPSDTDALLIARIHDAILKVMREQEISANPVNSTVQNSEAYKTSKNPHFGQQVSNCMRLARTNHAIENWQNVPKAISANLQKMANNIRPIGYNHTLGAEYNAIFNNAATELQRKTAQHLSQMKSKITAQFLQNSQMDHELIFQVSTRKLLREFPKIPGRTIRASLEELQGLMATANNNPPGGDRFNSIPQVSPPYDAPPTSNRNQTDSLPTRGSYAQVTANPRPTAPRLTLTGKNKLSLTKRTNKERHVDNVQLGPKRTLHFSPPNNNGNSGQTPTTSETPTQNRFGALECEEVTAAEALAILEEPFENETPTKRHKLSNSPTSSDESDTDSDELNDTVICLAELAAEANASPNDRHGRRKTTHQRSPTRFNTIQQGATLNKSVETATQTTSPKVAKRVTTTQQVAPQANSQATTKTQVAPKQATTVTSTGVNHTQSKTTTATILPTTSSIRSGTTVRPIVHRISPGKGVFLSEVAWEHSPTQKSSWAIEYNQSSKDTLIIADSNARQWQKLQENWAVHVFPGANLMHPPAIIMKSKLPPTIKTLVLSIGINNRDTPKSDLVRIMSSYKEFFAKLSANVKFMMIPQLPTFSSLQTENIELLNRLATESFGAQNIIVCPPPTETKPATPGDAAHYDSATSISIVKLMQEHLNRGHLNH